MNEIQTEISNDIATISNLRGQFRVIQCLDAIEGILYARIYSLPPAKGNLIAGDSYRTCSLPAYFCQFFAVLCFH